MQIVRVGENTTKFFLYTTSFFIYHPTNIKQVCTSILILTWPSECD